MGIGVKQAADAQDLLEFVLRQGLGRLHREGHRRALRHVDEVARAARIHAVELQPRPERGMLRGERHRERATVRNEEILACRRWQVKSSRLRLPDTR